MPHTYSPFKQKKDIFETYSSNAQGLYQLLPAKAKKQLDRSPHVFHYIQNLPPGIGTPKFYTELSRSMKSIKHPNLIYPVSDAISIHICVDKDDARPHYIPIEPNLFRNYNPLIEKVEREISKIVDRYDRPLDLSEKRENLLNCITEVCKINDSEEKEEEDSAYEKITKFFKHSISNITGNNGIKKISVNTAEFEALKYLMLRDKVGLGILEPLSNDPNIEDISCSGVENVFVEHRIFESLKTPIKFNGMEDLDDYVIKLSEKIGKPLSFRTPILDAVLPDESRINIVYGEDISKKGSSFSIRKFSKTPMSVFQLIDFGTLDYLMAAYIWICLREGMNCFIAGETASGKTTTMNAITTFIPPMAKIVSIENTPELQVPHKNWLREVTRSSKKDDGSSVEMFDLLKAALRQRPNEIIVGEVRGVEGNIVFQGMQTGHPAMTTFHASSVEKLVQRLTGDPISVPRAYIDNLNFVILQNAVRGLDNKLKRRITSICEIIGYDAMNQSFSFIDCFKWDPGSDTFTFTGNNNSYILERKIAVMRGIPPNKVRKIYKEVEKRARVLKKIHKSGVTGFYELFEVLSKMENENIFT